MFPLALGSKSWNSDEVSEPDCYILYFIKCLFFALFLPCCQTDLAGMWGRKRSNLKSGNAYPHTPNPCELAVGVEKTQDI